MTKKKPKKPLAQGNKEVTHNQLRALKARVVKFERLNIKERLSKLEENINNIVRVLERLTLKNVTSEVGPTKRDVKKTKTTTKKKAAK